MDLEIAPAQDGGETVIEVKVSENGIFMHGHACRMVNGQDRVCAAVSALTCNLINSLQNLAGEKIRTETASGMTVIEWQKLSDKGRLLVDSWFLGVAAVNQEYNCIKFI